MTAIQQPNSFLVINNSFIPLATRRGSQDKDSNSYDTLWIRAVVWVVCPVPPQQLGFVKMFHVGLASFGRYNCYQQTRRFTVSASVKDLATHKTVIWTNEIPISHLD